MTHPRLTQEQIAALPAEQRVAYIIACRAYPFYRDMPAAFVKDMGDSDTQAYRAVEVAKDVLSHLRSMTLTEDEKRRFAAIRDSIRRDSGNSIEDAYADRAWLVALFDRLPGAKP